MRPIKFRAKIKRDAGIYEVWAIDWLNQRVQVYRAGVYEWIPLEKIQSLMQFTGLLDKNGVEIYESDIVRHDWRSLPCEIIFENGAFRGKLGGMKPWLFDQFEAESSVIIGNIHEHPKLLEGK